MPPNIERYHAPISMEEFHHLVQSLSSPPVYLGGGTELLRSLHSTQREEPAVWIDLMRIPDLQGITEDDQFLRIGATTTCTQMAQDPLLEQYAEALRQAAQQYGSWQLRNRCTLGGLVSQGGSEADVIPALFALDAQIVCSNGRDERTFDCEDFFCETDTNILNDKEIVHTILIPKTLRSSVFLKQRSQGIRSPAKVSVALAATFEAHNFNQVRIAVGAVGPVTFRVTAAEGLLEGQPVDYYPLLERAVNEIRRAARPASDDVSNARYRKWCVGVLARKGIRELILPLQGPFSTSENEYNDGASEERST